MVNFLTFLAIISCIVKQWFAELWYDFRDPSVFYNTFIKEQINEGLIEKDSIKGYEFKEKNMLGRLCLSKTMIFEILLLLIMPYPGL